MPLLLPYALEPLLDDGEIGEDELGGERLEVLDGRRRRAGQIRKPPHHLDERVRVAELRHRLGVQDGAAAARGTRGREVDEVHLGIGRLARGVVGRERVHAGVGNLDDAEVPSALALRAGRCLEARQRVEDRRLPRARETGEPDLHAAPPRVAAARWRPAIVFPSTIVPLRIQASASASGTRAISAITSSCSW